jgi:alpha-L-fucosidase
VSKGGNLIMNVGPTARGKFDARALSRLDDYAKWMEVNSPSIYGCTEAPAEFVAPENTVLTYNPTDNRLYIHLRAYPGTRLSCPFVDRVACARFLHDGSEIQLERHGAQAAHVQSFYKTGCEGVTYFKLPALKPDVVTPVIEVVLNKM